MPAPIVQNTSMKNIIIKGARQHNLKNINVEIPRDKLVVITGLSGSGKSSLAFDTIYAEGQRKYVESLSAYARQFLDQMQKPDVDYIEGLSPAIAIEQRSSGSSPRSIIATVSETRAMGGASHPQLGYLGVMSAKNTAVNILILTTYVSFLLYRRSGRTPTVSWARLGNALQAVIALAAGVVACHVALPILRAPRRRADERIRRCRHA